MEHITKVLLTLEVEGRKVEILSFGDEQPTKEYLASFTELKEWLSEEILEGTTDGLIPLNDYESYLKWKVVDEK